MFQHFTAKINISKQVALIEEGQQTCNHTADVQLNIHILKANNNHARG